jgi:hypothetical protein
MSTLPQVVYEIPVIHQQNRIENMKQMLDALQHLEQVSSILFNRISRTVETQRTKLVSVQQRTQQAKDRVQLIVGRKQATSVFSQPTYPVPNNLIVDQKVMFNNGETVEMVHHKYNSGPSALKNVCEIIIVVVVV